MAFSNSFELEEKVDVSEYDAFQARLFGRVSELYLTYDLYTINTHSKSDLL